MQPDEHARMADIEAEHWWFRGKRDLVRRLIGGHLPLDRPLTILDAGCGAGQTLVDLAALGECVGGDIERSAAVVARRRGLQYVVQADCQRPPFRPGRFDLILLLDALEHVGDDVGTLARLGERLASGGRLILTVPAHPDLFGEHDVALGHRRRYTERRVREAASDAGLRVHQLTGYNTLLYPVVAAWRRLKVARPGEPARSDVQVHVPRLLNAGLYCLMCLENRLNCRRPLAPSLSIAAVLGRE